MEYARRSCFAGLARCKPADRPELCSSIDIVPTILAAAGAEIPQRLPGLNLLPNLQEGTPIERDAIFGESFAHDIADIENPQASLLYRWVIRDHSKLLLTYDGRPGRMKYPPSGGQPQLFDLKSDPHEKVNLAAKQPELVEGTEWSAYRLVPGNRTQTGRCTRRERDAPRPDGLEPRATKHAECINDRYNPRHAQQQRRPNPIAPTSSFSLPTISAITRSAARGTPL